MAWDILYICVDCTNEYNSLYNIMCLQENKISVNMNNINNNHNKK